MSDCALCEGLTGQVANGEHWLVAVNLNQDRLGKCQLVLRRHDEDVLNLTEVETRDLWALLRRMKAALVACFRPDHFNYMFLMNQDAHVHLHVVPRYSSPREWRGEQFVDPHFGGLFGTEQRQLPREALEDLRDAIWERLPDA